MCLLPGLVRLDLGVGSCLDGDGEKVFGVVSFTRKRVLCMPFTGQNHLFYLPAHIKINLL